MDKKKNALYGADVQNDPRDKGLFWWFVDTWLYHFFRLLGINLLFLLCCLPVITIPAALCGLYGAMQKHYRGLYADTMTARFFREFTTDFGKRIGLSILVVFLPGAAAALLYPVLSTTAWIVVAAFLLLAVLLILNWFVSQLVFLNLTPMQALRNALVLTAVESRRNFWLIVLHAVELTVLLFAAPMSMFLLLVLPVVHGLLVTWIVMPVLQERLLIEEPQEPV